MGIIKKKLKLLILPFSGFLLFIIGTLSSLDSTPAGYALIALGIILTLTFYFITLLDAIKAYLNSPTSKIFWLVAIICVPVICNVIYVIFDQTANRRQEIHTGW